MIRAWERPPEVRALVEPRPHAALLERSQGYEELVEGVFQAMVETLEPDSDVRLHRLVIEATERALIRVVLARTGGNQKGAALLLGVARNTLRSKALQLGLLEPTRRRVRR